MNVALAFDVILALVLLAYVVYGLRNGLSRTIFVIAGVIAGVIAAYFLAPLVGSLVQVPVLRLAVIIAVAIGLVIAGHAIGSAVGKVVRRGVEQTPLSGLDRLLGAIVAGVAAALVSSMVAFSVAQLGVPVLSRAILGSNVLRVVAELTPDPVEALLAQVRGAVLGGGLPVIEGALGVTGEPRIPQLDTGSEALNIAAESVVRITGNAYACGQAQTGSGFVIAEDRVITNAHVIAGVGEPVIEVPDGEVITGRVVYFDPVDDLAVLDVPGLDAPALPLSAGLSAGSDAAFQGYPYGGPFASGAAEVLSVSVARVQDVYGEASNPREIYTLAADVQQGNSGGPLLSVDGRVAGVIFARSADTAHVGYAMTLTELMPVAAAAADLDATVATGECIRS